jgi:hypothetical protein
MKTQLRNSVRTLLMCGILGCASPALAGGLLGGGLGGGLDGGLGGALGGGLGSTAMGR